MMLKDNIVVKVDMEAPEKAKAGSRGTKTMEARWPTSTAIEVGLGKEEDQPRKANARIEGSKAETGKTEVEVAWRS